MLFSFNDESYWEFYSKEEIKDNFVNLIRDRLGLEDDHYYVTASNLNWQRKNFDGDMFCMHPYELIMDKMVRPYGDVYGGVYYYKDSKCIVVSFRHHDCPVNGTTFRIYNGVDMIHDTFVVDVCDFAVNRALMGYHPPHYIQEYYKTMESRRKALAEAMVIEGYDDVDEFKEYFEG